MTSLLAGLLGISRAACLYIVQELLVGLAAATASEQGKQGMLHK
jgi:hypothetical protein